MHHLCIYCGETYHEEDSNAIDITEYCGIVCERDHYFEKHQEEY